MLTLILYFGSVIVARDLFACRSSSSTAGPAASARPPSRRSWPRTGRRRRAAHPSRAMTSPRLQSISSASVERDRLAGDRLVEIAVHRDDARDRAFRARRQHARPRRPDWIAPLTIVPAKPRKSRFGRFTHCTGMRNGRVPRRRPRSRRSRGSPSASGRDTRASAALRLGDVVALQPRDRDRDDVLEADLCREVAVFLRRS